MKTGELARLNRLAGLEILARLERVTKLEGLVRLERLDRPGNYLDGRLVRMEILVRHKI